ncbi:MAG TPA: hypothetical protein VKZ18_06330 [Polyangia bacterium]|nr:hypothetical protein [Polyangia bacterium]
MPRARLMAIALGAALLGCATAPAPCPCATPASGSDVQSSNAQHPDTPSRKRGVIVPSDVAMPGSAAPVPAITETASPAAGGN